MHPAVNATAESPSVRVLRTTPNEPQTIPRQYLREVAANELSRVTRYCDEVIQW